MLVSQSRLARSYRRRDGYAIAFLATSILAVLGCQSENGSGANQADVSVPIASFSEDRTSGQPGVAIQFSDTSTGSVSSYEWDFGALGTSAEPNPTITYPEVGTYSVSLTVRGTRGTSIISKNSLIQVSEQPTAGFSCTPIEGFVPLTVTCVDESSNGNNTAWDFGDGTTATGPNPSHVYTTSGNFIVEQTVSAPGGTDQTTRSIAVYSLGIMASPATGAAPLDVTFTADTSGQSGFVIWTIDGANNLDTVAQHRFNQPGIYSVVLTFGSLSTLLSGQTSIEYVVGYGAATAAFAPSVSSGSGPLQVMMIDDSGGAIDQWEWDFGDGTQCIYPAPAVPDPINPIDVCNSSSPNHEYSEIGSFDVTLTVTGPDANPTNPPIVSTITVADAVRVHILDASFELQTANGVIGGAWTSLRPLDETEPAEQVALALSDGADAGMPSDGSLWASLDGLGTDGSSPVDVIANGVQQVFMTPKNDTVLEFDYVLLYSEPPASLVMDAVTATVSDGVTTVEIPSARAEVSSPYVGLSTRFPTRDGSDVRVTPLLTASINLADAFPSNPDLTLYTLTIRTSNAVNEFRSPRAYVDNIRFTAPVETLAAEFVLETDPVVAGREAIFVDTSCPDPATGPCENPTSWRWDFDTQSLTVPPSASGSGDQDPVYSFPEAGVYDVVLRARLADLDSTTSLSVTVLEEPTTNFESAPSNPPYLAPATLSFSDLSTSDPADPIAAWSWDFGGWGTSNLETPPPVTFGQVGHWVVRLTITTASGQTATNQATISVE